jgi:hypothetical protein
MNDIENFLLRNRDPSIGTNPEATLDRQVDTTATMVANQLDQPANERSENFRSLTYVSSKGFFFQ